MTKVTQYSDRMVREISDFLKEVHYKDLQNESTFVIPANCRIIKMITVSKDELAGNFNMSDGTIETTYHQDRLIITGGATGDGTLNITLNGVLFEVPILSTDDDVDKVKDKVMAFDFGSEWELEAANGLTDRRITFTHTIAEECSEATFTTDSGVTGSISNVNEFLQEYSTILGEDVAMSENIGYHSLIIDTDMTTTVSNAEREYLVIMDSAKVIDLVILLIDLTY
ncbi:MAG: hypothetical protein JXR68_13025 [Bacteroidales bacterium]|nr:hypothetical protein [Bacteroidales bacterium]